MATTARTRATSQRALRTPADACIVRIYPPGEGLGRRIELTEDVSLGRDPANTVAIDSQNVSRRHARIVGRRHHKVVVDLGSTNGTYVNDARVKERTLQSGDLIRLGDSIFKFLHGSIEALYHEEIYRLTIIDGLTEAYNKRYLLEHLEREVARCHRYDRCLGVLMIDIDHFKHINDTHGHLAGDFVLRELGALVRGRIRREELFARYGGEEFALVIPETTREIATEIADALRQRIADHAFEFEGTAIPVTVSIGVGLLGERTTTPLALLASADAKLYRAKRAGRNRVVD